MHRRKNEFLGQVAKRFGFTDSEFGTIKARHVVVPQAQSLRGTRPEASVSDEELKSRYRALLAENHPDELIARGVPKEFITIAIEKVAAFDGAYKAIAEQRGI